MLLKFTVENYLSFRDETSFDMFSTGLKTYEDHVVVCSKGKSTRSLPVALIYGANASGKSNLIESIYFAHRFIKSGVRMNEHINIAPFKLDVDTKNQPSGFEFVIRLNDVVYTYGFNLSKTAVEEEWLYACFTARSETAFTRYTDKDGKTVVKLGRKLTGKSLRAAAESVNKNALFLTFAHDKSDILDSIFQWFKNSFYFIHPRYKNNQSYGKATHLQEKRLRSLLKNLSKNQSARDFVFQKISEVDVGIDSLDLRKQKTRPNISLDRDPMDSNNERKLSPNYMVLAKHHDNKGNLVEFNLDQESDGTRRLLELLPLLSPDFNDGKIVLVDEIESSLHPLLSRWLIHNCVEHAKRNSGCQFVFATHDTNLLENPPLRRDEIWFVSKDRYGGSKLSRFSEFKVSDGLNYSKGYLNGRFGGIPVLVETSYEG